MRNAEIADAMAELATLYELDGAIRYRVLAYREAARVIRQSPVSVEELARAGRATELPGVGKTLEQKILALVDDGEIPSAAKLKRKFPPSLIEVTMVPGVGAKTARRLYDELGVSNLEDLRAAAEQERIRELKGLGPKVEENVLASLGKLADRRPAERLLLSQVLPVAERLKDDLRAHPASDAVEVAGSARRRTETCHDIDLIATASEPAALAQALSDHPLAATKGSSGAGGARITTHNGIAVDLRIVAPDAYGNLLQHFTGSAEHNVELRERAVRMELSVSEHGITDTATGEVARYATEAEVYERLGLAYIEPELREANGEIAAAAAGTLPEAGRQGGPSRRPALPHDALRRPRHARGAWRRRRGPEATPTSPSPTTRPATASATTSRRSGCWSGSRRCGRSTRVAAASGCSPARRSTSCPTARSTTRTICWPSSTGRSRSVHTSFRISRRAMTERVLAAIEHPLVDCIGHLSGRLINKRDPYDIDVERVVEAAAAHRHDARDQRQPEPSRPLRGPRPARRGGRRVDLRQHRRPPGRHPGQHDLRDRHRAPRVVDRRPGRQHARLARVRSASQTGAAVAAGPPASVPASR